MFAVILFPWKVRAHGITSNNVRSWLLVIDGLIICIYCSWNPRVYVFNVLCVSVSDVKDTAEETRSVSTSMKRPYFCCVCNRQFEFSTAEILRHRKSCKPIDTEKDTSWHHSMSINYLHNYVFGFFFVLQQDPVAQSTAKFTYIVGYQVLIHNYYSIDFVKYKISQGYTMPHI